MSNIVKFFAATAEGAVDALRFGPDPSLRSVTFGNFDAEEALLDWQSHLTGVSFNALVDQDLPMVIAEDDDGVSVFLLSDALVDSLAAASEPEVQELAVWWVGEKEVAGMGIELAIASEILRSLVHLIRYERETETHLYCWSS